MEDRNRVLSIIRARQRIRKEYQSWSARRARRKNRQDAMRMRELNAANGVPEFLLLYPEPEDTRALRWFRLDDTNGGYLSR